MKFSLLTLKNKNIFKRLKHKKRVCPKNVWMRHWLFNSSVTGVPII